MGGLNNALRRSACTGGNANGGASITVFGSQMPGLVMAARCRDW
jgi:hypothetical protein